VLAPVLLTRQPDANGIAANCSRGGPPPSGRRGHCAGLDRCVAQRDRGRRCRKGGAIMKKKSQKKMEKISDELFNLESPLYKARHFAEATAHDRIVGWDAWRIRRGNRDAGAIAHPDTSRPAGQAGISLRTCL
jgi:hypothetical protein